MKSLVSILIPAFNAAEWVGDTVRSAISQTWNRKEIIIVDDGSTDGTYDVVRQFESNSIRVFRQENQGAAEARNKALSLSQGDYIQWLDADDLLAPDKISRQIEATNRREKRTLLSSSWGQFLYRHEHAKFVPTPLWCDLSPTEWLVLKMAQNLHMQTATWLVTRELTEAAGPWNTTLLGDDDGEYFCRVLLASDRVQFVRDAKVYYRATGTSSLSYVGRSQRKMVAQWRSMQLHIAYLQSLEDSERVRAACVQYLQNWLMSFYPDRYDIVNEASEMARKLGGELVPPRLSWKYAWLKALFGWRPAKYAQVLLPSLKWSLIRRWDKTLFRWQAKHVGGRLHNSLAEISRY